MSKRWLRQISLGAATLLLFSVLTFQLDVAPMVDWDEGWNFTVAQNWVTRDFYGRLQNGELAPPGLEASFPIVSTVAFSFRAFGVGIWQGRLAAVVTMLVAAVLLFWLVRQLFDLSIALATLCILVLLVPHPRVNMYWMARQMFAEPFMFVMILGGCSALILARSHTRGFIFAAILLFGTAMIAKAQALPFVVLALLAAIGWNGIHRHFKEMMWLGVTLLGAMIVWRIWLVVPTWLLAGHTLPSQASAEIIWVIGFVPTWEIRFTAFVVAWLVGTPILLGLIYFLVQQGQQRPLKLHHQNDDLRVALWVLATTWLLWYILFAHAGITRYLFSPLFFGAPFAALMLRDFTNGFDVRATLQRMTVPLQTKKFARENFAAWLAFLLLLFYVPLTFSISWQTWTAAEGRAVVAMTEFLNRTTPVDARIETYESPLFLKLERPYHYPPDALHVELNKRAARLPATVAYDALESDPDYLVVGPTARVWDLYEPVLARGAFRYLRTFGLYEIYERVRE